MQAKEMAGAQKDSVTGKPREGLQKVRRGLTDFGWGSIGEGATRC